MSLDLDDTKKAIVIVDNAIIVPPQPQDVDSNRFQPSGVLTADGALVENSITWSNGRELTMMPEMPDPATIEFVPGQHLFGGILFGHFGHFLVESTTRLWALDELRPAVSSMIFTPKVNRGPMRQVQHFRPLFNMLGASLPIRSLAAPVRVERLFVPRQGFGQFELMRGSEAFRSYMRRYAGRFVNPKGAEKIYISRSKLPRDRGGIVGEWLLEELLRAEGYEIYHPQLHPLADQVAQYKAAKMIVSCDCSPLHLVGFMGNSDQKVAIMKRRSMDLIRHFVDQLTLFQGIDAFEVDVLVDDWLPHPDTKPGRRSFGEMSFAGLHAALAAKGMVSADRPWRELTDAEREAEGERLRVLYDETPFRRMSDLVK